MHAAQKELRAGLDMCVDTEEGYVRCLELSPDVILADHRLPQFDSVRCCAAAGVLVFCFFLPPRRGRTGKPRRGKPRLRGRPWGSDPNENPPSPERAKQKS